MSARSATKVGRSLLGGAVALLAVLAIASTAAASSTQRTMVQDDTQFLNADPNVRTARFDEVRDLGVEIVKVTVRWREIAPEGARKPAGFVAEDPAAYALDKWSRYDTFVQEARARGFDVFMMLDGRAPDWASHRGGRCGGKPCPAGSQRPSAAEFGRFVTAVGRRYSGSYSDPRGGEALQRVGIWSIWNEPNLASWLGPATRGRGRKRIPVSPRLYRDLVRSAHTALVASGHASDEILLGEMLPFVRKSSSAKVAPLEFLRELACVDSRFRPYRGRAARVRGCANYRALPGTGVAYHPYTYPAGPRAIKQFGPDDASITTLGRLTRTLDQLGKRRRLKVRQMPIWFSEFGFQTNPPDPFWTPIRRVPGFMGESEWLAFRNRRVVSYSQYPLLDDKVTGKGFQRFQGGAFHSGLRFSRGKEKPGVYDAFRYPFFVRLVSPSKVEVFGGARAAKGGESVTIESGSGKSFTPVRGGTATLGPAGYFRKTLSVGGAAGKQFRFRIGDKASRSSRPVKRPDPRTEDRLDQRLLRKLEKQAQGGVAR